MGKNTDKLYITHSEWSQGSHSASSGKRSAGGSSNSASGAVNVPFWICSISLSNIQEKCGVCDNQGRVFDIKNILPRLKKHGDSNPIDGSPLTKGDLIKLRIETNSEGKYIDPVSFKEFQPTTEAVVIRPSGWVYAKSTIDEFNVKANIWTDLMTDQEFKKKDILVLKGGQGIGRTTNTNGEAKEKTETIDSQRVKKKHKKAEPTS